MLNKAVTTFLTVAAYGSMNKAAAQLYLSPTAVMNEINQLEAYLGCSLFIRSNRGLTLTTAGESFFRDAKRLSNEAQKAMFRARQISNPEQVLIRVGSSHLRPCVHFLTVWDEIRRSDNRFRITVVPFNDDALENVFQTLGSEFELLGSICDITNWRKHYQFLPLWDSRFVITLSKRHRLSNRESLTIEDLFDERVLFLQTGTSVIIDSIRNDLSQHYPRIHIEDYLSHYDLGIFNRCAEEGILTLSVDMWENVHPSLINIPVDWPYTIPYGVMYPLNASLPLLQFLELVRDAFLRRKRDCGPGGTGV